jgi:type I restriction enzyme S subunit
MNKISDIAKQIGSGSTPLRSNISFWNIPKYRWLKTEQLGEFEISETMEYISQEAIDQTSIKIWEKNTISVAMYGEGKTRGSVSILTIPMATNQACCNIEVDELKASYKFVYYWLKNSYKQLRALSSGVRKNLNSEDIKNFPIKILKDQNDVANILYTIDKKIQINNKINVELEKMAKMLYDYWFMQFDFPNANGKPYCSSGGEMVHNPILKREIPAGWSIKKLDDIVSINCRGITPVYDDKKDIPVINQKCIRNNIIDNTEFYWHNASNGYDTQLELNFMDTLINSMGTGTLGRISPYVLADIAVPHSCVTLLRSKDNITKPCFLYRKIKHYEEIITKKGTGSTGQTSLSNDELGQLVFEVPPFALVEKYEKRVLENYKVIKSNLEQNRQLAELRDFLLPLLMTGQVKVKKEMI